MALAPPPGVRDLVERFLRNRDSYVSPTYNETETRREFVDPLFKLLGWDIDNERGWAEQYKEVVHEYRLRVGGASKAPDYCFRIGGTRKFFVETKKPSVRLNDNPHPAYQLRRYAYSSRLPLSILTNFGEWAVYDCTQLPKEGDSPTASRVMYLRCEEYLDRWDEIAAVFSRDAVLQGSFDKYSQSTRTKRGTAEVDKELLREVEGWREDLAKNIALRNKDLSQRQLNFAVQQTIDRILFLRICEDRGIEPYGQLQGLISGSQTYKNLCQRFLRADERYNSGLFHFNHEPGRAEAPDELTPGLTIDDKPLKDILKRLYYPQSPYEFSVLPADILGQVYEQFLGKVIVLDKRHRATVEEKPEVKKSGGVYYTPSYIVNYICRAVLTPLLADKTPRQAGGETPSSEPIRVVDPACGSGSFLLGAYEFLLNWYREEYVQDGPEKWAKGRSPRLMQGLGGEWRLTTQERKRILLTHIFGVDIDVQAVEVTKLSLLLKVLEGETAELLAEQLRLFHERALPDLAANIKCGNSLVGLDYYRQLGLSGHEQYDVNPFDWASEFGDATKSGGFDAVIGNPPWVMAGYYIKESLEYLKSSYRSATGKFDLYYLFLERAASLVSSRGSVGMIVPNKCFHTSAAASLRQMLNEDRWINEVIDFRDEQIFEGATNYSCILILKKDSQSDAAYTRALKGLVTLRQFHFPRSLLGRDKWYFADEETLRLFERMESLGEPLGALVKRFGTGVQSGADTVLMLTGDRAAELEIEPELLRPVLRGRDVRAYGGAMGEKFLLFPYEQDGEEWRILPEPRLRQEFPTGYSYLVEHKTRLARRVWFGRSAEELSGKWYGMMYLETLATFLHPHLLTPSLSNKTDFALGTGALFVTGTAGVTAAALGTELKESPHFLLGILNSRLMSHYATGHSPIFSGGFFKFSAPYLKALPIIRVDSENETLHDEVASLVTELVQAKLSVADESLTEHEERIIQRQIAGLETAIDDAVYRLYRVDDRERALVDTLAPSEEAQEQPIAVPLVT